MNVTVKNAIIAILKNRTLYQYGVCFITTKIVDQL